MPWQDDERVPRALWGAGEQRGSLPPAGPRPREAALRGSPGTAALRAARAQAEDPGQTGASESPAGPWGALTHRAACGDLVVTPGRTKPPRHTRCRVCLTRTFLGTDSREKGPLSFHYRNISRKVVALSTPPSAYEHLSVSLGPPFVPLREQSGLTLPREPPRTAPPAPASGRGAVGRGGLTAAVGSLGSGSFPGLSPLLGGRLPLLARPLHKGTRVPLRRSRSWAFRGGRAMVKGPQRAAQGGLVLGTAPHAGDCRPHEQEG